MKVVFSNLKEANKVLSLLNSKGIPKNEITVLAPTIAQFETLSKNQAYDNNQEVMMFSWISAIIGAAFFAILSFLILGLSTLDPDIGLNFKLVPPLVLFGILIGGAAGYMFGHVLGVRRTLFKSRRVFKRPMSAHVELKFRFPDVRQEELEFCLKTAKPISLVSLITSTQMQF